jgi:uncharacterized protein YndB with AHSA1/START domain
MEQKTKVHAEEGKHDLFITREFDLPLELLFKAYTDADIVEQWMGTKVVKLENKNHGSFQFETIDPQGNKHRFNGTIHTFSPDMKIVRTFEFEKMLFGVQLEVLNFEKLSEEKSKLTIHTVFESIEKRDQQLKMPFAYGINIAHDRLQNIIKQQLKK